MFAHPVGMTNPAAALAESAGLTLKPQDPLHHSTGVALGSTEIHELMCPPDRGHHRPFNSFDGRGLLLQLADQAVPQLPIVRRGTSESLPSEKALAGGSGGEEKGEAFDSLGRGRRWVQKSLMLGGASPAAPLPGCPNGIDVQQVTTGHDGLDGPGVTDVGKRILGEYDEICHLARGNQAERIEAQQHRRVPGGGSEGLSRTDAGRYQQLELAVFTVTGNQKLVGRVGPGRNPSSCGDEGADEKVLHGPRLPECREVSRVPSSPADHPWDVPLSSGIFRNVLKCGIPENYRIVQPAQRLMEYKRRDQRHSFLRQASGQVGQGSRIEIGPAPLE